MRQSAELNTKDSFYKKQKFKDLLILQVLSKKPVLQLSLPLQTGGEERLWLSLHSPL